MQRVNTAFQFYVFVKLDIMKQALPIKHAKHFEQMAELIYAELTQGRESTRLPHTHKFTSLKNVVISAQHKIDKLIHIQAYMQLSKEEYAKKKESIMVVWRKLKVPSRRITVSYHSASLTMLNSYRRDRIFNQQLTAIKHSYHKVNV